jgi:hypothetical protein
MSAREVQRLHDLYDHHCWANHLLLDVTGALGEEAAAHAAYGPGDLRGTGGQR